MSNALDLDGHSLDLRRFERLFADGRAAREEGRFEEAAAVLGIHKAAASNRYVRALRRLKEIHSPALGMLDDSGMNPRRK